MFKKTFTLGLILSLAALLLIGCSKGDETATKTKTQPYAHPKSLISAEQLQRIWNQPNLTIIDTRPGDLYEQGHIPGAINYNVKRLSDPNRPGRFAPPKILTLSMIKYGINSSDRIVVYSDDYSHARLWSILNMYGIENVQILNGGFEQWKAKGYKITTGSERRGNSGKFNITDEQINQNIIIGTSEVSDAVRDPQNNVIIDARSTEDYIGGHIPGAVNITWDQLVNEDLTFKTVPELKEVFQQKQITPDKQIIVYSKNAIRASYVYFALDKLLGYENIKIYDGFRLYWAPHKDRERGL